MKPPAALRVVFGAKAHNKKAADSRHLQLPVFLSLGLLQGFCHAGLFAVCGVLVQDALGHSFVKR